jgi:hypothetical protein
MLIVTSVNPCSIKEFNRNSIIVVSPSGINGFGNIALYGARRVPIPPAKINTRDINPILNRIAV